jgi:Ca-activated chloride channel family protein
MLRHWFAHPQLLEGLLQALRRPAWQVGTAFSLLTLLLVVAGLILRRRRQNRLARFGSRLALQAVAGRRGGFRWLRRLGVTAGVVLLLGGMAGPQWGRDWSQPAAPGRDLVVVLDTSRSMLAQDVLPNRFERARQALADLSYSIQKRGGHRLALVVFAARARIVCPLTHDYNHFRMALADLDPLYPPPGLAPAGPESVSGTRIGAGLQLATKTHDPQFRGYQEILLLSDGDDPVKNEQEWRVGAAAALSRKIPVHTVGIGDPATDSPIPLAGEKVLRHNHEVVMTRLEEQTLELIARATGGTYTPARTGDLQLGELFRERIEPGVTHDPDADLPSLYEQHYVWFYGGALALLALEMAAGPWWPRADKNPASQKRSGPGGPYSEVERPGLRAAAAVLVPLALLLLAATPVGGPLYRVRRGNAAFERGDYAEALYEYGQAEERIDDPGLLAFNEGTALYQVGRYREAELHFRRSREDAEGPRRARLLYNLGNCLVQQARPNDVRRLQEAVDLYGQCLDEEACEAELAENARHNLELGRLLLARARARPDTSEAEHEKQPSDTPPRENNVDDHSSLPEAKSAMPDASGRPERVAAAPQEASNGPARAEQATPGRGNLGPLPDDEELAPLTPEDAEVYLEQAARRIQGERREYRRRPLPVPAAHVLDW